MRSIALCVAMTAAGAALAAGIEAGPLDRIIVATAQGKLMADAHFRENVEYFLYRVRPPEQWGPKHPAWAPARGALMTAARPETLRQMKDYWRDLQPVLAREMQSSFQPGELAAFTEFANSAAGAAYLDRRLAEIRAKNADAFYDLEPEAPADLAKHLSDSRKRFDALPASEKKRVEDFLHGPKCAQCYRPAGQVMDDFIAHESDWLREVFTNQFESTDYHAVDTWVEAINSQLKDTLPVNSKKQVLGTLEMRKDSSLGFTFHFYWHDKADGGALTLEFPAAHAAYREVAALAPGLAPGQSRVLYRDTAGVISDQP